MAESQLESTARRRLPDLVTRWTGSAPQIEWGWGGCSLAAITVGPHVLVTKLAPDARAESIEAAIGALHSCAPRGAVPFVLVPYMTPAGAERCEAADVAWADLSGNARIEAVDPDGRLWIHVAGQPNASETRGRPRNAFAPKSARLARLLLSAPSTTWTQKEIAQKTGIDPGHVSRLVKRLTKADLVAKESDGLIVVPSPSRLLDAWREGNAHRHEVIEGHLPGRSGEERARRLDDALNRKGRPSGHALTGLAAAWAYTGASGFRSVACYVKGRDAVERLDDAGFRDHSEAPNLRLMIPDDVGVFDGARTVDGLRCVAPAQAYVDLAGEPERAEEFAESLRSLAINPPTP